MKTNIFLVHTEYHLMLSINLIVSKFMDMVNHIYITEGKRVRKDLFVTEKNIQIHRIEAKNYGTSEFLHQLLDKEPANFFFFQEVSSDNMYLSYWLHHKGVNVALLQDGLKPYVDWKRKNLAAHILLDTIMFHKEILKRKTYMPYFRLNNLYHYGGWDFIDEVWLSFPDKFKNKANKKLRQLPDFTYRSIDILIEEHFATPREGIQVRTFREPKFLGTIGSIKFVDTFYNDTVLVMNSDLFTNIDYEDFFLHFQLHDAEMSVAAVPYNVSIQLGILDLDGRNIKGLIEKPKYNYYANAGIYLIKKRALAEIPEDTFFHATHLIEKLIAQGKKVIRYPLNGTWIDIGTHQEYERAKELVKHLK